jgi:HEAT repeat protein
VGGYEADVMLGTTEDLVGFGRELMAALAARGLQSRGIAPPDRAPAVIEAEELASAQHAVFLIGAEFSPFIDGELRRLTKQMLDEPERRILIPVVLTRSAMRHLPALLQRMALQVEAEISVESLADRIVAELRPDHRRAPEHTAPPPTKPAPPERADVRLAIGRLTSPNPRIRQVAVATLVRSGGLDHLSALASRLSDDDVRVREEARKGVLEIVSLARQSDPEFRLNETILPTPVEPLSQVGVGELLSLAGEERGLDLLFSHVDHTDPEVRARVATALGLVGGPGIVDWLGVLTEDPKEEVVGAALVGMIRLLGKLTPEVLDASKRLSQFSRQRRGVVSAIARAHPGPQPVFLNSLNGLLGNDLVDEIVESMLTEPANELVKDWILERVRSGDLQEMLQATEAVAKYSEPRLVEILVERMGAAFGEHRIQLIRALGASRMKEALAPLGEVLVDPEPPVRLAAIEALSKLSTREATSMLEPMLGDPMPSVRRGALNAIARLGGPEAAEAGRRFLKDESPDMRLAAIRAITSSPLPADVELLAASTDDADGGVRSAAVAALSEIAHPSSVSVLQRSLGDSTSTVRRAALRGLVRIARLTLLERRLLTHAVDGDAPWLDVMEPITQDWLVRAAERVNLTPSAIRIRLEGLNRVLGVSLLLPPVIDDPQTASPN